MEPPLRRSILLTLTLFIGACAHSGPFVLEPVAPLREPAADGGAPQPLFFLQPFKDQRIQRPIFQGRERYFAIKVEAAGLSTSAKAWRDHAYQDASLLWHRSLGQAMAASGLTVAAAAQPGQPAPADARYVVSGTLRQMDFKKQGHDAVFGTTFSGTDYIFQMQADLQVDAVGATAPALKRRWTFKHAYYDPKRLGSSDADRVPGFFVAGLRDASADLAGQDDLRILAGLAPYTPTPTPTETPQMKAPTPGAAVIVVTPTETPDSGAHWYNPKTGHRVDPSWNFDPEDGTPRRDFVLRGAPAKPAPTAVPTPTPQPTLQASPAATPQPTVQTSPAPTGDDAP